MADFMFQNVAYRVTVYRTGLETFRRNRSKTFYIAIMRLPMIKKEPLLFYLMPKCHVITYKSIIFDRDFRSGDLLKMSNPLLSWFSRAIRMTKSGCSSVSSVLLNAD